METSDIPQAPVSDWQPTTRKLELAILGKLAEEAGELVAACARCIIQGLDEREPRTGKLNIEWLQDELADVSAMHILALAYLDIDRKAIEERRTRKLEYKRPWFDSFVHAEIDEQFAEAAKAASEITGIPLNRLLGVPPEECPF